MRTARMLTDLCIVMLVLGLGAWLALLQRPCGKDGVGLLALLLPCWLLSDWVSVEVTDAFGLGHQRHPPLGPGWLRVAALRLSAWVRAYLARGNHAGCPPWFTDPHVQVWSARVLRVSLSLSSVRFVDASMFAAFRLCLELSMFGLIGS